MAFMLPMWNLSWQHFFAAVERLWTFFSRSTSRWTTLREKLKCSIKQESESRWNPRADTVEVVYKKYFGIVTVLEEMNEPDGFVVLSDISTYNFFLLLNISIGSSYDCKILQLIPNSQHVKTGSRMFSNKNVNLRAVSMK